MARRNQLMQEPNYVREARLAQKRFDHNNPVQLEIGGLMPNEDRSYATDNGFYIGDRVEVPDGRKGTIDEIVLKNVNYQLDPMTYITATVVRLDQELWLDHQLTRVE